jgi:phage repressor protein C with HTH and peptisase S24 domain
MICSVAMCNSGLMGDESLEAQGDRLRQAREAAGYGSAAAFAHVVKIKPVTYRAYEAGQNGYAKLAHHFADKLGVDARWLLRGEGGGDEARIARPDVALEQTAKEMGLALVPQFELGYSMGGGSIFTDYPHTGFVPFQRDWLKGLMRGAFADLFVARGEGDSMQPTMLDGDIVLIDSAQKDITQQDRIWALSYGDLGMIKRVRRLPGGTYRIMSDNPSVTPLDAADGEMHVVGRVIWIGRRI